MSEALARTWDLGPASGGASPAGLEAPPHERRKNDVRWNSLGPVARIYVLVVTFGGAFAIAASMPHVVDHDVTLFAILSVLSLVASLAKVALPVPRSASTLSVCYVLDFTTLLVLGPDAATLTAAMSAWSQCALRGREPGTFFQVWFSVGALALTVQAAGLAYAFVGGQPGLPLAHFHGEALVVAAAVFFLVNSVLVAAAVSLSTGQALAPVWIGSYLWSWPGHLVGFALAVATAYGIGRPGWWLLVPVTVATLALTYENFKAYVTRFTDSLTDPLTGLSNIRHLKAHVAQALARSQRDLCPMSLILVDLDEFKAINDTYGHGSGDAALCEVGSCMQQSIRSYDLCARSGGDEFVMVLPGCDLGDAQGKATSLQGSVAALRFHAKSQAVPLSISVGVAAFPDDGETLEELLATADARMFADKDGRASGDLRAKRRHANETHRGVQTAAVDPDVQQCVMEAQRLEAVGELADGVAHDFNNALTAIMGYSDLVAEQLGPDKPIGRDVQEICHAAQYAASLTHQLLSFSRKQTLSITEVDPNDVMSITEAMLQRLLGEQIVIVTQLERDLHSVMANKTQLEQIVMNLAVNARDAMPQGGMLTIDTRNVEIQESALPHPDEKPGPYVQLSVTDTGTGMTPEVQAKIFEVFFTTKEPGRGTGLGLAAVQNIVSQLGGFIRVRSELGLGSSFHVLLPSTAHVANARPPVDGPSVSIPTSVGIETILLVEDEAAVRQFATIALERHGYRVLEAHSAEAALTLLERLSGPIHLLITDVVLPGMEGCALADRVERAWPSVPILLTTGYADAIRRYTPTARGDKPLLLKPFTARALLEKTRELLDLRAA